MTFTFSRFLCSLADMDRADIVLVGVPFDGTSSFRPGSRFAPAAIRSWSEVLETYSPELDRDLEDVRLADAGDLEVPVTGWERVEPSVVECVRDLTTAGRVPVLMGGEHLVTLAAVRAALASHPDLAIIHLDAHLDLRDSYQGVSESHATVMRRVQETVGTKRLHQWGQRSGTREEWRLAREQGTLARDAADLVNRVGSRPVYLSLDLDVLDPSAFPDTGTPEPGGVTFHELQGLLAGLLGLPIVAADVVEYCPLSGSSASGAAAAKAVREVILLCAEAKLRGEGR